MFKIKSKKAKKAKYSLVIAFVLLLTACNPQENNISPDSTTTENAVQSTTTIKESDSEDSMSSNEDGLTVNPDVEPGQESAEDSEIETEEESDTISEDLSSYFTDISLASANKTIGKNNPLYSQRYGADPYAISYNGRVYIYMTADNYDYDGEGNVKDNSYGQVNTLNVISSADLVNWTDHGWISVNGAYGVTRAGSNSWAPTAVHKNIDGVDKFFVYYANNANGIGVLVSDSPTGPFENPHGDKLMIDRNTPGCEGVVWLFDPAVFVDDDGKGYIYFGGGVPEGEHVNPKTGRMAELGDDMISLATEPVLVDAPYFFEAACMNKIGDKYFYSYCTNWSVDSAGKEMGIDNAVIAYMEGDSPLGPFEFVGTIVKNTGAYFGDHGNNHHCIFEHEGQWYIAYHARILASRILGGSNMGYRSTHLDSITITDDGYIAPMNYTENGVSAITQLDPFERTEAETIGTMAGIDVKYVGERALYAEGDIVVSDMETGDWILVYGADFKDGATKFTANVSALEKGFGIIEIRAGGIKGEVIGHMAINSNGSSEFEEITVDLEKEISGINDIAFIFFGEGYNLDYWYFSY